MAFDGYLALAGREIINSSRVRAYVQAIAPQLGLQPDCCDCDGLPEFLGESYTTPLQDEPEWFVPYRTESAEFLGLIPLTFDGFDDSTRGASIVELSGDGGVATKPRQAARQMRVSALMVASTAKGLDYGTGWLRAALEGSACPEGNCAGDDLCFLSTCPEPCDDPLTMDVLNLDYEHGSVDRDWDFDGTTLITSYSGTRILALTGWLDGEPISRTLTGLTPGAVYRVDLGTIGAASPPLPTRLAIEAVGSETSFEMLIPNPNNSLGRDTGGVFDFVATATTQRIVIRAYMEAPGDPSLGQLNIRHLTVTRRVDRSIHSTLQPRVWPGIGGRPEWSEGWAQGPATTGWTPTRTALGFKWVGSLGATADPQELYVKHPLLGLTPGNTYTVRVGMRTNIASDLAPQYAVPFGVSTADGSFTLADMQPRSGTIYMGWATHTFKATAARMDVIIGNGVDVHRDTTSSTGDYNLTPIYLRLEDSFGGLHPTPVSDESIMRTLRNVTVTSGPTITNRFDARGAFIQTVEWTMMAGQPRVLGRETVVLPTITQAPVTTPETACMNGQPVVRNLITNPSFETGTTGWTAGGVSPLPTLSNPVSARAITGTHVLRVTHTSNGSGKYVSWTLTGTVKGQWYAARLTVVDVTGANVRPFISIIGPSGETVAASFPPYTQTEVAHPGVNKDIEILFYMPVSGTPTLRFVSTADGAHTVDIDAVMVSPLSYVPQYVDGSVPGGSWDGTANASASRWMQPSVDPLADPDCPPPPLPPRPPVIVDDCIVVPTSWLRYTADIPSRYVQQGSLLYPIVALTTAGTAARGVRVRFYPNPSGGDWMDLDPCSYCGEFYMTYLPPNATITIDASLQAVTMTDGSGSQSARQLVVAMDGGPVVWPELTCDMAYVMVVDVDASSAPLVDMTLSAIPAV